MTTLDHLGPSPTGLSALRVIPIAKPGVAGISFALAITDEVEASVRKNATSQGLLAGTAMRLQPDPSIWRLIDHLKTKR